MTTLKLPEAEGRGGELGPLRRARVRDRFVGCGHQHTAGVRGRPARSPASCAALGPSRNGCCKSTRLRRGATSSLPPVSLRVRLRTRTAIRLSRGS